jgi:hypothetical protein
MAIDDPGLLLLAARLALLTILALSVPTAMLLDWGRPPQRPRLAPRLYLVAKVHALVFTPVGLPACGVLLWLIDAPWWGAVILLSGVAMGLALLALFTAGVMYVCEWPIYCLRIRSWRAP